MALGHVRPGGKVSRADVAEVAAHLLDAQGARGYVDLIGGDKDIAAEVKRFVDQGIDCIEGEDVEAIKARYAR